MVHPSLRSLKFVLELQYPKDGCAGRTNEGTAIVRGRSEATEPDGLHVRCAKRLWKREDVHFLRRIVVGRPYSIYRHSIYRLYPK